MDPAGRLNAPPRRRGRRVRLAALADIADGTARGFQYEAGRTLRRVVVLRSGDAVTGFADACPHMGVPLPWHADDYLTPDGRHLRCASHGALFDREGLCVFGPCKDKRLSPQRLEVVDGIVWLLG